MTEASGSKPPGRTGPGHCWWQARVGTGAGADQVLIVASRRHPDGSIVQFEPGVRGQLHPDTVVCTVLLDLGEVRAVRVGGAVAPAPPVWYVELAVDAVDNAARPSKTLVAFLAPGPAPGELLTDEQATQVPVASADQVGALRWWSADGEVDQIDVHPDWRRRHLGSAPIAAAAGLSAARGRPRLWGHGQRTALGERFRNSLSWRDRTAELSHLLAPMTPGDPAGDQGGSVHP